MGYHGDTKSESVEMFKIMRSCFFPGAFWLLIVWPSFAAERFVAVDNPNPVAPYTNWATAAKTIQAAIEVSSDGDQVWVTNGVYRSGGKGVSSDLINRVAVDRAITVQSVNGPKVTVIQGALDPTSTNGPQAVRCAWLTNGAHLRGFTLRGGATLPTSLIPSPSTQGGGVWGTSSDAYVSDCWIVGNTASYLGGGAASVTLDHCIVTNNVAVGSGRAGSGTANAGSGGGAVNCNLVNCFLGFNTAIQSYGGAAENCRATNCAFFNNRAAISGSAANKCALMNCTVVGNTALGYGSFGGAVANSILTNSIVYGNFCLGSGPTNHTSCTFMYSDSNPLPPGLGNIALDPQLLPDGVHLAPGSPCAGAGLSNAVSGTDLDGQSWSSPPSMGCDEWHSEPVLPGPATAWLSGPPPNLRLSISAVAGQPPFYFAWFKDSVLLTNDSHFNLVDASNLLVTAFGPADAGAYQLVVSNSSGVVTSAVSPIVVHCVDVNSAAPTPPYSDWNSAAVNIQDAINIALPGEFVLVTNGVYSRGGAVVSGGLTNRVALTNPVTLMSMSGPAVTTIQGTWDPGATNGPLAARCAWVGDGAVLSGFTLHHGATRTAGLTAVQSGGGVWAASSNALISDCVLATNAAYAAGGGVYQGRVQRCTIQGNVSSQNGGGESDAWLESCLLRGNIALRFGGGGYAGNLVNCTVVENRASQGGGLYLPFTVVSVRNSIVLNNSPLQGPWWSQDNRAGNTAVFSYSCTSPSVPGAGNLGTDPALLDGIHLAVNSPCRGAGVAISTVSADLVGNAWANPPSMGCFEVSESFAKGPLSVTIMPGYPAAVIGRSFPLFGRLSGWPSRVAWSYGDGSILTNVSVLTVGHAFTNTGDYTITFTAFNADYPDGVSTNLVVSVAPLATPILSAEGLNGTIFTLNFTGQATVSYTLERASDLTPPITWQPVTTAFSVGGALRLSDAAATNTMMFYRVRAQ